MLQVYTLYEGSYSVDASKQFIPFDPQKHQAKDRPASLFIHVQPFLVSVGNELILLDTGLGYSNDAGQLLLHQHIREAGFDPDDVSMVLMSHLHFDHSGGMVHERGDAMELSFPNATYVMQRGEWETAFSSSSASYKRSILEFIQRNAHLQLIEGSGELNEYIRFELTGGHCPYHQVFLISDGEDKVFFGGDVLPEPEELIRKFIAKYDYDGRKTMELREEFGHKAVAEHWKCLFYHAKTKSQAYVTWENAQFKIV